MKQLQIALNIMHSHKLFVKKEKMQLPTARGEIFWVISSLERELQLILKR